MKAILAIALFVAVASAQYCVFLEVNDETCEGHRTNWPTKVCSSTEGTNVSSAASCDLPALYTAWADFCPLKNTGNDSFCEGTGYATGYTTLSAPCLALLGCTVDEDCDTEAAPATPVAEPALLCFDCCLFCFENATCIEKVGNNDTYTDSEVCTPCAPPVAPVAEPVAPVAEPQTETPTAAPTTTPTTTTTPRSTPRASSAAATIVASTYLIVAAALLA
jgi:hypothetical protein